MDKLNMVTESSAYLVQTRSTLDRLLARLLDRYEYASILAWDSECRNYTVSASGTSLGENATLTKRGFVVKAYEKGEYAEYSFNKLEGDIDELAKRIITMIDDTKKAVPEGISRSNLGMLADEPAYFTRSSEFLVDPRELGDEKILGTLVDIRNAAKKMDERILDVRVAASYQCYHKMFLSKNRCMNQNLMWMTGNIRCFAKAGDEVKSYFESYSNLGGAELLERMMADSKKLVDTTISLIDSEPMVPGTYDFICTQEVTGMIVHEAFGHGVEMDMFAKDRAFAAKCINEYVASPLINMHDGASAANETATYFFDDDGVIANDTLVIDKGVLVSGISDTMAALRLGTKPTGNSRRESYERKAYTRMTNTFFEAGTSKYEDMIASIDHGFLLENATIGMEDPKNWGIQCMVNMAREIKDGKFTGKIFSPIVLTGYVPDLLKSISMISDEKVLSGSGFCGKGYKEWVKVSDGGPYIKAKIRLG